jgi:hypothetical protein
MAGATRTAAEPQSHAQHEVHRRPPSTLGAAARARAPEQHALPTRPRFSVQTAAQAAAAGGEDGAVAVAHPEAQPQQLAIVAIRACLAAAVASQSFLTRTDVT